MSAGRVRVTTPASCGNSPRAEILADLTMAWAERRVLEFIVRCRGDAAWHRVGSQPVHGHSEMRSLIEARPRVEALAYDAIITHGRLGSCSGTVTLVDATVWTFCHIVRFASTAKTAPIARITTFEVREDAADLSDGSTCATTTWRPSLISKARTGGSPFAPASYPAFVPLRDRLPGRQ